MATEYRLDGDPCVGHPCGVCGKPFEPGQLVQGDNLHHEDCRLAAGGALTACRSYGATFTAEDDDHIFCSEACVVAWEAQ